MNLKRERILRDIDEERSRQSIKWGGAHMWGVGDLSADLDPPLKAVVLFEEVGEVARAVFERDDVNLREELVQVAACAVAWLESLG